MSSRILILELPVVLLLFSACTSKADDNGMTRAGDRVEALVLTATFDKAVVHQGEKLVATLVLRNVSKSTLWVNKRLLFNDEASPPALRELWVRVRRSDGTPVQGDCVGRSLPPLDSDYGVLQAGESITTRENLSCLGLAPGRYELVARYADGNDRPPPPPTGSMQWRKVIQSPPVTFEVVPAPATSGGAPTR